MESELFGYVRGAFTGAAPEGKAGLIEAGHTGTVFLDEVGELTPAMQVKLLQVLEERSFTRVGDTRPTQVDVRIIAATNRDLAELVAQGRFRKDLYYRLHVVPLAIPPLRRRPEDIPALAMSCLERINRRRGLAKRLEPEVLDALLAFDYPGNVRELINLVERMVVMSEGDSISLAELPGELRRSTHLPADPLEAGLGLKEAVSRVEAQLIARALERHATTAQAAQALGVHPTTLWRKMVRLGLQEPLHKRNRIALVK
jgi:transcriptional regulator with PAS, ATPase and Fis domain